MEEEEETVEQKNQQQHHQQEVEAPRRGKKRSHPAAADAEEEHSETNDDATSSLHKRKKKKNKKKKKKQQQQQQPAASSAENIRHKNRLHEFAQRCAMQMPSYEISNLGFAHAPAFRAIVTVDGQSFVSSSTFSHVKEAEQDAARVAYKSIELKIKQEGCPLLNEDKMLSKSIFNEFAAKITAPLPTYEVTSIQGPYPMFVSIVKFRGQNYTGSCARSKKEAEQNAAHAAIKSILGTSLWTTMLQVIKAKGKMFAATHKMDDNMLSENKLLGGATMKETTS